MLGKIKILATAILVGVAVALTYYIFEAGVSHGISFIWEDLFDTEHKRLLVVPICIVLTLVFFGLQHYLDPKSETHESHGLGEDQAKPKLSKFFTILTIGFFSLVAGASLGPEAVLVPACMVAGGIIGSKLLATESKAPQIVSAAAIIALFAAFFHSFWVGLLTIFLVKKVAKADISTQLILLAILSSGASTVTLNIIDPANAQYFKFPTISWNIILVDIIFAIGVFILGYLSTFGLKHTHQYILKVVDILHIKLWWHHALLAGIGLSFIYILGGPLVQFTGNESIKPLLNDAKTLGIVGVLWIFVAKLLAIAWSKAVGYRGGLIFPMIFIASTFATMATLFNSKTNFMLVLIAGVIGIILADKKAKILF